MQHPWGTKGADQMLPRTRVSHTLSSAVTGPAAQNENLTLRAYCSNMINSQVAEITRAEQKEDAPCDAS